MRTVLVRYKTSETDADANETLVRAVFAELRARAPGGIRYATLRLPDGVTFVHIATVESKDTNPLVELPAFKAFQKQLKERCVEPPVVSEVSVIGTYGQIPVDENLP
jgi:quinol monooxygenase YgiN